MPTIDDTLKKLLDRKSLNFSEAEAAMEGVMTGQGTQAKLAAWLTALRMKGENADEIGGCAAVMNAHATRIPCEDPQAVDIVGTGGDGAHTYNISTTAALVAAGAGLTVAKHGNRAVSSKSGAADVLGELGIQINLSPEDMATCLKELGIAFLFAPLLHPAMKHAMPVRKEIGIRTVFNILGPLSNPAGTKHMVIGVYDPALCPLMAEACRQLGKTHVMVIHGNDGLDELTTTSSNQICELHNGEIREYEFDPGEFGIPRAKPEDLHGGTGAENAIMVRKVLSGEEQGSVRDIVTLNAAAGILAADKATDWPAALELAADAIDSGRALAKLEALIKFTCSRE